jgi:hypothetical protein
MSLANYEPIVLEAGLNRVEFGGTHVEIPDDLPLYCMLPIGTLRQVKEGSWNRQVRSGLNPTLVLGDVNDVKLYYDTRGRMTIPEKQMVLEVGRKKRIAPDVQRYMTEFGGKRKTKTNRTKKRKTKRRRNYRF